MRILPTGTERKPLSKISARWGLAGSGMLYFCPYDNTILLLKRSRDVEDPGLWGIPGGAIKSGRTDEQGIEDEWYGEDEEAPEYSEEELRDTAYTETQEELGHLPEHEKEQGQHTTVKNNFHYTTFLAVVTPQQKNEMSRNIRLNWENENFKWFKINLLPQNIHPGVVEVVEQLIQSKNKQLEMAI